MKSLTIATVALLQAVAVNAMPQRGGGGGGTVSNELKDGACKPIILIFARASTEPGNMGISMGPMVCTGLKKEYPNKVLCQGVGQPYSAGLMDNVSPAGTSQAAIGEATKMFTSANTKCGSSTIVFGGYSQGTAVMMNTVSKLPANVKQKVVGGVLFGYTKNAQTKGTIPDYPPEAVKVFCNPSGTAGKFKDGVCGGTLNVNGGHFAYLGNGDGPKAVAFLKSKIDASGGAKGGASTPAPAKGGEEAPAEPAPAEPAPAEPAAPEGGESTPAESSESAPAEGAE